MSLRSSCKYFVLNLTLRITCLYLFHIFTPFYTGGQTPKLDILIRVSFLFKMSNLYISLLYNILSKYLGEVFMNKKDYRIIMATAASLAKPCI